MCVPTARSESSCTDGLDNDCNGATDCADRLCAGTPGCGMCTPISRTEGRCRDMRDDDCDGLIDCADPDCRTRPFCMTACTPTAPEESGVAGCTNGIDEDCDGLTDCGDSDCRPLGGECCDGTDDDGNGFVDEFACRCNTDPECRGIGGSYVCWSDTFSVCAPACNTIGGDRTCREFGFMSCNRMTGECI
jgi:hypothetical protein